ncbi:MAG: NADH:ubiquinone oxidoreductase subunit 1, partial [Actinomycetia bacterium]|nr:NADH:ubiquinone oxidoreductase subunit 1 [Actinomycetes bacterium]
SVPRLRYDQLMNFGWKYLIELAFLWLMVTAVIRVADDQRWDFVNGNRGLTIFVVTVAAGVGAALVYGVLMLCIPRDDELASIQEWD